MFTTRPRRPRANSTVPARAAKIVSSRPMPAPSPGRKRVPRWRTMISPPVTVWPAKTLTPRRCALESRPLRLNPSPFLCAIFAVLLLLRGRGAAALGLQLDPGHLDAGEVLPVPGAPRLALLGLELEHPQPRATLVTHDLRLDLDPLEVVHLDVVVLVAAVQQRLERDLRALGGGRALEGGRLPLSPAVLLTAGLDDGVGHDDSALARDRRRPPLRPRRREAVDCRGSSSASPPLSTRTAVAAVRPTSSMRTRRFWPTWEPPPCTEMMYPSIFATASSTAYMCGSTMCTSTSSPRENGSARSSTSSTSPSIRTSKWSSGRPSEPSKWNRLPVSSSSTCRTLDPLPVSCADTRGLTWMRKAAGLGRSLASSTSLRSSSIEIVSSDLITPSPSQVGHGRVMISRTPSVTFWRVISTSPSGEISAV